MDLYGKGHFIGMARVFCI